MITDPIKYKKFLKILSLVGFYMTTYSHASEINYNYTASYIDSNSYTVSIFKATEEDTKEPSVTQKDSITPKEIARDNAPYKVLSIEEDVVEDDFGILHIINVHMELPLDVNDDLIVTSSMKATNLIDSNEYLINYL